MKASVVDLRHNMKSIFRALRRNEKVEVLYHGKPVAILSPVSVKKHEICVQDHPVFGMLRTNKSSESVQETMDRLRGPRFS